LRQNQLMKVLSIWGDFSNQNVILSQIGVGWRRNLLLELQIGVTCG